MAVVQLRHPTEGRAYFDAKKAAGKTSMEAMRALKRRLSNVVYTQLLAD
jgi:transposase